MELFGNSREWQSGTSKLEQNHRQVQHTKERNIMEKKDEVGRGCFKQQSVGEKARGLTGRVAGVVDFL